MTCQQQHIVDVLLYQAERHRASSRQHVYDRIAEAFASIGLLQTEYQKATVQLHQALERSALLGQGHR